MGVQLTRPSQPGTVSAICSGGGGREALGNELVGQLMRLGRIQVHQDHFTGAEFAEAEGHRLAHATGAEQQHPPWLSLAQGGAKAAHETGEVGVLGEDLAALEDQGIGGADHPRALGGVVGQAHGLFLGK